MKICVTSLDMDTLKYVNHFGIQQSTKTVVMVNSSPTSLYAFTCFVVDCTEYAAVDLAGPEVVASAVLLVDASGSRSGGST